METWDRTVFWSAFCDSFGLVGLFVQPKVGSIFSKDWFKEDAVGEESVVLDDLPREDIRPTGMGG